MTHPLSRRDAWDGFFLLPFFMCARIRVRVMKMRPKRPKPSSWDGWDGCFEVRKRLEAMQRTTMPTLGAGFSRVPAHSPTIAPAFEPVRQTDQRPQTREG
jgi:hypothetical protein